MPYQYNDSYWETRQYRQKFDLIVIGAGIVGLSTALAFRAKHATAKILILERGVLPNGASTKNAGFACFGSLGELVDDLQSMSTDTVLETVRMRYEGLQLLRQRLGDKTMDYQGLGGFEVFTTKGEFQVCLDQLPLINELVSQITHHNCYSPSDQHRNTFGPHAGIIKNSLEGQLDTGLMMRALHHLTSSSHIEILNNILVTELNSTTDRVILNTSYGEFCARYCVVATNGFASQLLEIEGVAPGRAQVLVTEPIQNLALKGSFHFEKGYYYFRNINNRILLGGGRNIDSEGETTFENGLTDPIQFALEKLLRDLILPNQEVKIAQRWSGIMGLGSEKKPILKLIRPNVIAAVRMGGMGVAIGSLVGKKAADLIN
jgi:glycine/D-amino acid oxidase-like deaminating enzyme